MGPWVWLLDDMSFVEPEEGGGKRRREEEEGRGERRREEEEGGGESGQEVSGVGKEGKRKGRRGKGRKGKVTAPLPSLPSPFCSTAKAPEFGGWPHVSYNPFLGIRARAL